MFLKIALALTKQNFAFDFQLKAFICQFKALILIGFKNFNSPNVSYFFYLQLLYVNVLFHTETIIVHVSIVHTLGPTNEPILSIL